MKTFLCEEEVVELNDLFFFDTEEPTMLLHVQTSISMLNSQGF